MTNKMNLLVSWIEDHKDFLKICFISVLLWGIAAHGFMFMQWDLSHDSLGQFYTAGGTWRYSLGRVFVPFYVWLMRRNLTIPWLVGMYALTWLFLSVIIVCSIFSIKSKKDIFLIAGAMVTNECVIALTGSYLSDLDCDMLALLLAVSAVRFWKRNKGRGSWLLSTVLLSASLGLYQSYLSVAVTLILMVMLVEVFQKKDERLIIHSGLRALTMLVCGGLLYILWLKGANLITGVSLIENSYNSLTAPLNNSVSGILRNIVFGWAYTFSSFIRTPSLYESWLSMGLNAAVCCLCAFLFLRYLHTGLLNQKQKLLAWILVLLIPIGVDVSFVLAGFSHDLMHYAHCFFLIFLIVLIGLYKSGKVGGKPILTYISYCIVSLILLGNVMTSNGFYVKKDLETKATLSLFTRIADRIETMDDYKPGETPVIFVGHPDALLDSIPGFENLYRITGGNYHSASNTYYKEYFKNVLQRPINVVATEKDIQNQEDIAEMPSFPDPAAVRWAEGSLIVKLSS